jgi:hypothetical protein
MCWFWRELLAAACEHPEPVVFKIPEAVRPALDEFHLSMEPFGNPVVSGKPPHSGDLVFPVLERPRQGLHRFKSRFLKLPNHRQELLTQLATMELCLMLLIKEVSNFVHLIVDNLECWLCFEDLFQARFLFTCEFLRSFTEQS